MKPSNLSSYGLFNPQKKWFVYVGLIYIPEKITKCMDQLASHNATHELGYQKWLSNVNGYPMIAQSFQYEISPIILWMGLFSTPKKCYIYIVAG